MACACEVTGNIYLHRDIISETRIKELGFLIREGKGEINWITRESEWK
jgi:hypothetical protein